MRSLVLNLPDHVYAEAERTAAAQGYEDMGSYIAHLVANDSEGDAPLSEESLRAVAQARTDVSAGRGLTSERLKAALADHRAAWLQTNPQ